LFLLKLFYQNENLFETPTNFIIRMLLGTWLGTWKWFQMPTCPTLPLSPSQNRFFLTQAGYPVGKWITCLMSPLSPSQNRFFLTQAGYPVGKWITCLMSPLSPSQNRFFLTQAGYPVGKWIMLPYITSLTIPEPVFSDIGQISHW
jgi:hypothetical protein